MAPRAFIRPHMFTALFLGVTLLLLRLDSATEHRRYQWALVPLFALWANVHSGFTLGLGLVLTYWEGETIQRQRDWKLRGLGFLIIALATLVNPHHIEALLYPIHLMSRPEIRANIAELRSVLHPAYRDALFIKVLIASGAALVVTVITNRRREWSLVLPGALFLFLAVLSIRGSSEYAVILPAVLGSHGAVLSSRRFVAYASMSLVILLTVAGGVGAFFWGQPMGGDPPPPSRPGR